MMNSSGSAMLARRGRLSVPVCMAMVVFAPAIWGRQISSTPAGNAVDGQRLFTRLCSGCHGGDGHGTEQGPALVGNTKIQGRSVEYLHDLIHAGIPAAGMPAFPLPEQQLRDLAAFVHSLNALAADNTLAGDPAPGEQFFFGKGQCASCHMVDGRGKATGPDLSNVGRERTASELRTDLLDPSARITPGYRTAVVKLRTGGMLHGFVRAQGNFDIRLQDFSGRFHVIDTAEVASVEEDKQSAMPAVQATAEEVQNLLVYLSRLTGVRPGVGVTGATEEPGGIEFSQILHPKGGEWLTYNGNLSANRYSDLKQINTGNVDKLQAKWTFSIPLWRQGYPDNSYFNHKLQSFGIETTPLVADGVMYITGPNSAYALDAKTGRQIWTYARPRDPQVMVGDAAMGTNRGVALLGDKVFMVTNDAHLLALNRTTGHLMWEAVMPDEPQHYGSTIAPLVVNDMVIAGVSGGDWGIRGFISAYRATTGERIWRRWVLPAKGEPGIETWKGPEPKLGGGATWLTGSYDPETSTLYWTTGNPWPDSDDKDRPGDNLYTCSVLALDPKTGDLKWHFQFTPHDVHDWDAEQPPVLVDTEYRGQQRKLLLQANRNGFFYVLDRTNGKLLLAKPFLKKITWASGIDANGRPEMLPTNGLTCPRSATNWSSTAFSPATRLYYIMADEDCVVKLSASDPKRNREPQAPGHAYLRALDIETGRIAWEMPDAGPVYGMPAAALPGVLGTAGGILFFGDHNMNFEVVDQKDGKNLWHFPDNEINTGSPMTYMVEGKQYIAVAAGSHVTAFALP